MCQSKGCACEAFRGCGPADSEGEELRDVAIWLWALGYSKKSGTTVAFISNDNAYWDGTDLCPQMVTDIKEYGGQIAVYRTIEDFVKLHAPAQVAASDDWVKKFVPVQSLEQAVSEQAAKELIRRFISPQNVHIDSSRLENGTVFKVDSDTEFAELQFKVVVAFEYAEWSPYYSPNVIAQTWTPGELDPIAKELYGNIILNDQTTTPIQNASSVAYTIPPQYIDLSQLFTSKVTLPESVVTHKKTSLQATVRLSVRVKAGVSTELSILNFEL